MYKILFTLVTVVLNGCTAYQLYEEPEKGKKALLQLDLEMFTGNVTSHPDVLYHEGKTCENGQAVNHDIDHYYMDGNPEQSPNSGRWIDLVGYEIKAEKLTTLVAWESTERMPKNYTYQFSMPVVLPSGAIIPTGGASAVMVECGETVRFTPKENAVYRLIFRNSSYDCSVKLKEVIKNDRKETLVNVSDAKYNSPNCAIKDMDK